MLKSLDSPKASGSDRIPVEALRKCEPENFLNAEVFNMCLKEPFQTIGKSHWWSLLLRMLAKDA